jgi:hypothetical protein
MAELLIRKALAALALEPKYLITSVFVILYTCKLNYLKSS